MERISLRPEANERPEDHLPAVLEQVVNTWRLFWNTNKTQLFCISAIYPSSCPSDQGTRSYEEKGPPKLLDKMKFGWRLRRETTVEAEDGETNLAYGVASGHRKSLKSFLAHISPSTFASALHQYAPTSSATKIPKQRVNVDLYTTDAEYRVTVKHRSTDGFMIQNHRHVRVIEQWTSITPTYKAPQLPGARGKIVKTDFLFRPISTDSRLSKSDPAWSLYLHPEHCTPYIRAVQYMRKWVCHAVQYQVYIIFSNRTMTSRITIFSIFMLETVCSRWNNER